MNISEGSVIAAGNRFINKIGNFIWLGLFATRGKYLGHLLQTFLVENALLSSYRDELYTFMFY